MCASRQTVHVAMLASYYMSMDETLVQVLACMNHHPRLCWRRQALYHGYKQWAIITLVFFRQTSIDGFPSIFSLWQLEGKGSCDVDIDQSAGSMVM